MTGDASLAALTQALQVRQDAGIPVQLWLRDDDAIVPSDPLERLLKLSAQYSVPLTLALIPATTGKELAERLNSVHHVRVAVHGWSHQNHAGQGEKKQELGHHRPEQLVLAELSRGFSKLQQLYPSRFVPVLVPPWNRISPEIAQGLKDIGFQGLSTFGAENSTSASVANMNTHVDLIDWKGTRGGRARSELLDELSNKIANGTTPIGILTHHLVHDSSAWRFLEELFILTTQHEGCCWLPINKLLALQDSP